jgi:dTDP-4-dehydrorhamnose 3,5-epimerase
MKVTATEFPEVVLIEPQVFADPRGHFLEIYQAQRYSERGLPDNFVQDALSYSFKGVLRGLHYQLARPQGKLVSVIAGEIFDVVVDIRRSSATFTKWKGLVLSSRNYQQLYIPPGFAHGFCVLSDSAAVWYKLTEYYLPKDEYGIRWDDPALGIDWPLAEPLLSARDRRFPVLAAIDPALLPA